LRCLVVPATLVRTGELRHENGDFNEFNNSLTIWLVVWNMNVMTSQILGMSSSQLTNSMIFQRGWNHQPAIHYSCFCLMFYEVLSIEDNGYSWSCLDWLLEWEHIW
jgi:hypothetical protein